MSTNSRFTVAIHILTLLAHNGRDALTSEYIAGSVNTNPVVIRRLFASLRAAKLVASHGGVGGGWQLLRSPETITLKDIFQAVERGSLFPLHSNLPNPRCPVGGTIQRALKTHFESAQLALEKDLAHITVADLVKEVKALAR
jgi:Rrf2 family protein